MFHTTQRAITEPVCVTEQIYPYISEPLAAAKISFPTSDPATCATWIGSGATSTAQKRLTTVTPKLLLTIKRSNSTGAITIYYSGGPEQLEFCVRVGDVVEYKTTEHSGFGKIWSIGPGHKRDLEIHLQFWRHDMKGLTHGHPGRLHQLETHTLTNELRPSHIVRKLDIIYEALEAGKAHPVLASATSYICSHRFIEENNSYITIPVNESECPGCLKSRRSGIKYLANDIVRYQPFGETSSNLGILLHVVNTTCRILPLSRWDTFLDRDGLADIEAFRRDNKLFYVDKSAKALLLKKDRIHGKAELIGLSRIAELGAAIREKTLATQSDFWIGQVFVAKSENIFSLIDTDSVDRLWLSSEKQNIWAHRQGWLRHLRFDALKLDHEGLKARCIEAVVFRQEVGSKIAIIDCCAGVGAFSAGLVNSAGAVVPLAIENNPSVAQSYARLHPNTLVLDKGAAFAAQNWSTIKARAGLDKYDHTILQAGIPCQPFSRANRKPQHDDPRCGVLFEVLSLLQVSRASYLLLECVEGILHHVSVPEGRSRSEPVGQLWSLALRIIMDMGYQVSINVHQGANYGVPQDRKRVFIWAAKKELILPAPPPPIYSFFKSIGDRWLSNMRISPQNCMGAVLPSVRRMDALSDLPKFNAREAFHGTERSQFYGFLTKKSYGHPPRNNYQLCMRDELVKRVSEQYCHVPTLDAWERMEQEQMSRKDVFPTLTTSRPLIHPDEKRPLSRREICRITGIPDSIAPRLRETCTENELIEEYTHATQFLYSSLKLTAERLFKRSDVSMVAS